MKNKKWYILLAVLFVIALLTGFIENALEKTSGLEDVNIIEDMSIPEDQSAGFFI